MSEENAENKEIVKVDKEIDKIAKSESKEGKELGNLKNMNYIVLGLVGVLIILAAYEAIANASLHSYVISLNATVAKLAQGSATAATTTAATAPTTTTAPNPNGFGNRTTNIDQPLNASELNVINNMNNSYFEIAGEMLLNHTLTNPVFYAVNKSDIFPAYIINGKPTVIYIGALSCLYCGENRWAMALALSRFGNFTALYKGYTSFGDYDLPTLYWSVYNYTTPEGMAYGAEYNSKYINFIAADFESPVTGSFDLAPLSYFINNAPNSTYADAIKFMNSTGTFAGTPFMLWGKVLMKGANAVVFGNTTPKQPPLPLEYMTHDEVISQFKSFNDQFAWSEYAAADVYVAYVCNAINNTAPVCSLPAIAKLETVSGLQ